MNTEMFVKSIDWIDEENIEADVEISDGKYFIICFACPFNYQEGDVYKDTIHCLDIEYVYTSQENSYYVERIRKSYNYILKGKVVDLSNKIMKVGEIKIDVSNTSFPNDIYQDQFIEVKITRMDLY